MNTFPANRTSTPAECDAIKSARETLTTQLPLIGKVTAAVCRRRRLSADDGDDFCAHVRMKLVEDNYWLLRQCRDSENLETYLRTVIDRLLLDYRVAEWGRWRPCAHARRSGAVAILLDRMLTRDGFTFDEACELLRTNYRVEANRDDLYALSTRLPVRTLRRPTRVDADRFQASDGDPEINVTREDARRLAVRHKLAIQSAIRDLSAEDRRLLHMRYRLGRPFTAIAEEVGMPAKPLYRRVDSIVRALRRTLRSSGRTPSGGWHHFTVADVSLSW